MSSEGLDSKRTVLFQTESFEIVSIEWTHQSATLPHNHGWSQCFVLVEEGVFENRIDLGMKTETQVLEVGQVLSTPVGARHEMICKSARAKTLHVYTPKVEKLDEKGLFDATAPEILKSKVSLSEAVGIDSLKRILSELKAHSISTHSPYFMNQLFAGVLPQMLLAEEFIAQTRTTLATYEASPVLSVMESEVVESLGALIGWDAGERSGVSVPGGSAANFMAIHCARHRLLPDHKQYGNRGAPLKVFVSAEAHYSFKKACAVLGIGTANLVSVAVDHKGRMLPSALAKSIAHAKSEGAIPLLVAATAGTTVLGSFDELRPLAAICKSEGLWLHVDGAWGGPALFSKKLGHLLDGVELADSMTFDAHKLLGANLTSSFFLTKHPTTLLHANDVSGGDYLFHSDDPFLDRGKLSWQCGRKADAASFWTIWKSLGSEGFGDFVDRLVGLREEVLPWIKSQPRLELVSEPDFLNICVRIRDPEGRHDPEWSKSVRERLKKSDQAMVNYSANAEGSFLRLILAHPYLNVSHLRQILEWALEVR